MKVKSRKKVYNWTNTKQEVGIIQMLPPLAASFFFDIMSLYRRNSRVVQYPWREPSWFTKYLFMDTFSGFDP
jgi:hypothetical protein